MIDLSRTVRFCINPAPTAQKPNSYRTNVIHNAFGGWPSMSGVGAYYELEVVCRGEPDPVTGYLVNISAIDGAVREHAIPIVQRAFGNPSSDAALVLQQIMSALQPPLRDSVTRIRWRLTPYYSVAMSAPESSRILMSQQFEFSASHRLHVPELGESRNREIFGKCNNPNSHGHNYRVEVNVAVNALPAQGSAPDDGGMTLQRLEQIVNETVITRFDHKHLNLDTAEFAALNPSVENIARICYELLQRPIAQAGGELKNVRIWETEKTSCLYPAE